MNKEYSCCGQSIEVLRGEAVNNRNTGMLLYAAMCRCNQSLLYVVREMPPDKAREDHVNDVLSHLYDIPPAVRHGMSGRGYSGICHHVPQG